MSEQRELVLARIRRALQGAPPPQPAEPARAHRRSGALAAAERVELLCERIGDYRAQVRRVGAHEVAVAIAEVLAARRARRVCIPADLPAAWRPEGVELAEDAGFDAAALEGFDGVITAATLAIAQTGTLVLTGGPGEGRRALTLIPDLHVCVIEEAAVVEIVPEAIARLGELVRSQRRAITFISGPSATSDIELRRVEGVHGPRNLVVLVAAAASAR